ncbi:MAG: hypothetical protein ACRDSJ_10070 [Rubrobacteraceae bacterium]
MNPDRELLRRFEPVMRYTKGEKFFPIRVEPYVALCSLWRQSSDKEAVKVVAEGELTLEKLAETRHDRSGAIHFLKFIDPLNVTQLAAYKVQQRRKEFSGSAREARFRAGRGRLARVGYLPRFLDVLFSLTLLARGRVSGDTAAAARIAHERMPGRDHHVYYGRVVRQDGWVALQYWFFHAFNDWRSGFFGVNDHEADWEMACVYLYEDEDELKPEWVAYSSHDFSGDDLRRRWDDPEFHKEGEHPVIYSAAGSHASYFAAGEYLTELDIPFLNPAVRVLSGARRLWQRVFRQYRDDGDDPGHVLSIPFVDYARGDGLSIGPEAERGWKDAALLDPAPDWASSYRGLWGLYARDPVAGEDAPAGPMHNRDGTVRKAWRDPIGWSGLNKTPPPNRALEYVSQRRARLQKECARLEAEISDKNRRLSGLGVEAEAMSKATHLKKRHEEHRKEISAISEEIDENSVRLAADRALMEALEHSERNIRNGEKGSPRAHIKRAHRPASETNLRFDRIAEAWAATSIALFIVVLVALILFASEYLVLGLVALVSLLVFVESGFRKKLTELTTSVTVGLATIASLILLYEFFWQTVVASVIAAAAYMVWENLRELWT